jgi:hypothetical protein
MRLLIAILCLLSSIGCSTTDPITTLSTRLKSDTGGMWRNGGFPIIDLPGDASSQEVLAEGVKMWGFDEGRITKYKIINTREVSLEVGNEPEHIAVLIDSNLGRKIFLMQYHKIWWTRFYDANQ